MTYEDFIKEVQTHAKLDSRQQAKELTKAVLEILGTRLFNNEAEHLAAQLPRELGDCLRGHASEKFGLREFIDRVAKFQGIPSGEAIHHAEAVFAVLKKAVTMGELSDVRSQLPEEFKELLGF